MNRLFDMLTCIHNAQQTGLSHVIIPIANSFSVSTKSTKSNYIFFNVLELLRREGYIRGFSLKIVSSSKKTTFFVKKKTVSRFFVVYLKYDSIGTRLIKSIFPISTQSRREYISSRALWQSQITSVTYIISTNRGILSDGEARRLNVGGEVLFGIF